MYWEQQRHSTHFLVYARGDNRNIAGGFPGFENQRVAPWVAVIAQLAKDVSQSTLMNHHAWIG